MQIATIYYVTDYGDSKRMYLQGYCAYRANGKSYLERYFRELLERVSSIRASD